MKSSDLIKMSFGSLWKRKVRTILTIFGVLIGATSILVMLSIGVGVNESITKDISSMGSVNTIEVSAGYGGGYYEEKAIMSQSSSGGRSRKKEDDQVVLNDEIIDNIANIPHVTNIMKTLNGNLKFVSGKYMSHMQVIGVDPEIMEAFGFTIGKGRLLQSGDTTQIVFGGQVPYNFRDPNARNNDEMFFYGRNGEERPDPNVDVLNDSMIMTFDMSYGEKRPGMAQENKPKYKRYRVEGVGVMPSDTYNEFSWQTYMNIDYLEKIMKENQKALDKANGVTSRKKTETEYSQLKVMVDDIKNVEQVQQEIVALGLNAHSMSDILDEMKKTSGILQAVLGGIGAISLFVASIGITNTMVMSIYERTKEIGVMKVLGCTISNIRGMFLIESGLIGFIGGILGILLSLGISFILNKVVAPMFMNGMMSDEMPRISIIPLWLVGASLVFSTIVGIIAGLYPSIRATRISSLEAIRTD